MALKLRGMHSDKYQVRRHRLIEHLRGEGIRNEAVLAAMEATPRHLFVGDELIGSAYEDRALPIGEEQTISQPYIVALMSEMSMGGEAGLGKVLEIGTGCGYQTAVLAQLFERVYTVERIAALQRGARQLLPDLGIDNVEFREGDGFEGWEEFQPYDAILVTAAPAEMPQRLLEQLACGGRLVIPVGDARQYLRLVTRTAEGYEEEKGVAVKFVPMLHGQSPASS